MDTTDYKEIYLAGGCFWGSEKYLSLIRGVKDTQVGYANGRTHHPSYEDVCRRNTGHAETVKVTYDPLQLSLESLLALYYESIDPTSVNRQGGDRGTQYRTGIYYVDQDDRSVIDRSIAELQKKYKEKVAVEVLPLQHFYPAEEYHQKYLDKNPGGYCHISPEKFERARTASPANKRFQAQPKNVLKEKLNELQYNVTQNNATEPPFANEYFDHFEEGIYVDITTGEPLFSSLDKFESGCGWPSFSKPLEDTLITERTDYTLFRKRTEVRSSTGDAHLGHVFEDGPMEKGGLRYCINSAAIRFIPKKEMEEKGYGYLLPLFR